MTDSTDTRLIVKLALAAVLLIAIGIPIVMYRRETLPDLNFRPAGIQLLAPQGVIEYREIAFAWTSSVVAAQYRVDIGNAGVLETHYSETSQILRITMKPGAIIGGPSPRSTAWKASREVSTDDVHSSIDGARPACSKFPTPLRVTQERLQPGCFWALAIGWAALGLFPTPAFLPPRNSG
jgi:hypothetical protein